MGIISFITAFIAVFIVPVMLIMVWVAPHKINVATPKNPTGKYPRKDFLLGLLGLWIISLIICGVTAPKPDTPVATNTPTPQVAPTVTPQVNTKSPSSDTSKENIVTASADKTFDITPDEFGERFMKIAQDVGLGKTKWEHIELTKGSVNDTFTIPLGNIAMVGSVDKNGKLKGLNYALSKTSDLKNEVISFAMMAGLSARAIDPTRPKEESAGEVVKLINAALEDFNAGGEGRKEKVIGKVRYIASVNKSTGINFAFEPA